MNKLLLWFLVIIPASLVFTQSRNYNKGLLWEISGNGLQKPSYLFGTIHSSKEIFFELSDSVLLAIESTECFAAEVNLDSLQYYLLRVSSGNGQYPEIPEILSEEEYDRLNDLVKEKLGISLDDFPSKDPVTIISAILNEEYKGNMPYSLDEYLYKIAKIRGKKIQGVETYNDQLNNIDSLTTDETRQLLLKLLEENKNLERYADKLMEAYQEQDLNKLQTLMGGEFSDVNWEQKFLVRRNFKMSDKIDLLIKEKSAFIAVGAAHLINDNGLIELLMNKGYSLRAVQITNTGLYKKYIDEIVGQPWVVYSPASGGFSIEMPGEAQPFPMSTQIPGVKVESGYYTETEVQIIYGAVKFIYPLIINEGRKDSVYSFYINNLRDRNYQVDNEITDIIQNGLGGKEFTASLGSLTFRSRLFIRENNLYVIQIFYSGEELNSERIDRFFNSFKLLNEKNTPSAASDKYTSETGAFRVKFDFNPYYQIINTNDTPVHVYTSSDKLKGSTNAIMYTDGNPGSFHNDSSDIDSRIRNIASRTNGRLEYFTRCKMEIPCFYFKIVSGRSILSGRIVLRGRRFYFISNECLQEKYDSVQAEEFLDSFELIGFQPIRWTEYKDSNNDFSVNLPALPTVESYSSEYDVKYIQTYISVDSASGTAYEIYKCSLSEYYQAENDSALFSLFIPDYFDSSDVFVERDTLIDGIKIRDKIVKPELTMNYIKSRVFINGNSAYKFEVSAPGDLIFGERVSPFFDSIKILEVNNNDIYSDKTDRLFNDLESDDTLKLHKAASYCSSFKFDEGDTERIYALLERDFADDGEARGVRASLLNSLRSIESNSKLDFIKGLYPRLKGKPVLQVAALGVLSGIKSSESTELFLDLILSDTPQTDYTYFLLSPFYNSVHNLAILFPRILELLKYEEYKSDIYDLLATGIDSMVIQPNQYTEYEQIIFEDCQKFIAMRDSLTDDPDGYKYDWEIGNVLKTFPAFKDYPEVLELLKSLSSDPEIKIVLPAVVSLLKSGEDPDPDTYLRIAEDIHWRNYFYDELSRMSKSNLFPDEYLSQQYFAESDLCNWLYDEEYEVVDTLMLIDTLTNEDGNFYLYKFNFDYEPESYYVGVSGPQPVDKNLVVTRGRSTKTAYSLLQNKSIQEHWNELLKAEYDK